MAKAQEGDAGSHPAYPDACGPGMLLRLDAIKDVLTEHSKLVRDIYKNPTNPAGRSKAAADRRAVFQHDRGREGWQRDDSWGASEFGVKRSADSLLGMQKLTQS
jgi:hypothetical protein